MEHIGERIKIIRKMYNIKQKEFAERVSVSASYISKVESGKEVPTNIQIMVSLRESVLIIKTVGF